MSTFWILWHPDGKTPPTVTFQAHENAVATAELMMNRIGQGTMYIMRCDGAVAMVKRTKYIPPKSRKK